MKAYKNTTIRSERGRIIVRLYKTDIIAFDTNHITLHHGGWINKLTAKRMNEVARAYDLPFRVNIAGGKRVHHSNNLLYKEQNPSGAQLWVSYGNGVRVTLTDSPYTFERTNPLPVSAAEIA